MPAEPHSCTIDVSSSSTSASQQARCAKLAGSPPEEIADRWLDLMTFDRQPLIETLSRLVLEYRIVQSASQSTPIRVRWNHTGGRYVQHARRRTSPRQGGRCQDHRPAVRRPSGDLATLLPSCVGARRSAV